MSSLFESVCVAVVLILTLALIVLLSVNEIERSISKKCEMQGSFIIGKTVYLCEKGNNHIALQISVYA